MLTDLSSTLFSLHWRQPLWLILALLPLLLWLFLRWKKNKSQQQFADKHLLPWLQVHQEKNGWHRIFSRNMTYSLAWVLFALALAGPRLPDTRHKNNAAVLDIMLVVDLSQSMQATDIKPSRLRRATLEIYEFLSLAKNIRLGVTVYAARPHLFVPLTSDLKALQFYLKDLDSLQLPTKGSDSSSALAFAKDELLKVDAKHKRVILWLSDGDIEANAQTALSTQIKSATNKGIDTYILGMASPEGAAIQLADGSWLESDGQAILSKMNSTFLEKLSNIGNGAFSIVRNDESDWERLYQKGMLASVNAPQIKNPQQWKEYFMWFLTPAIFLLLIALFPISPIRKKPKSQIIQSTANLFIIFIILIFSSNKPLYAADNKESMNESVYKQNVKHGIIYYQNAKFGKSKSLFIQAVLNANNDKERGIALHNLGNALFQTGDYANASSVFTDALRYAPTQGQSIKNRQLAYELNILLERERKRARGRGNYASQNDNSPLFDLPEQLPFMLSTRAVNLLKASLPKIPDKEINRLLKNGIQHIQLIEGSDKKSKQKLKEAQDIEQARIYFMALEEQQSNTLWKRLFEIEEGFPGKLKKPKTLPGVRPW